MAFGRTLLSGCVVLAALALAPAAMANEIVGDIFQVTVSQDGVSVGFMTVSSEGTWNGQAYTWTLDQDYSFLSPEGAEVARLIAGDTHVMIQPAGGTRQTPQVTLGFAVTAGSATTTFDIRSALLSFPTMVNPTGKATVGMTVSDRTPFGGATLTGIGALGGAYIAQYNGAAPSGTTFNELVTSPVVVPAFGQNTANGDTGWLPIAGAVSNISTQLNFTLTARDSASGTSNFEITPEPASLLLLAAAALLRRR